MSELETLRQGVRLGKHVMHEQVIKMFKSMKSNDPTDTEYSLSNVITIAEAIQAVQNMEK
jgi:hypothetical protein